MTFTCLNGRAGFFSIVAVCLLHSSDATLPFPMLGGNGSSLIPGLNLFSNSPQLGTLQRDLTRASSFLMHYASAHAQDTVNRLSQGQLPRLPLAELGLRALSGGGASSGSGAGNNGLGAIGDAIGGVISSLGSATRGAGTGSSSGSGLSLGGTRPRGPVTVTLAPDPPSDDVVRSGPVTVTLPPDPPSDVVRSGPVTVTLPPDPPSDVVRSGPVIVTLAPDPPSDVVRSGPVTVTLPPDPPSGDAGASAIDIRSLDARSARAAVMGGGAGASVDRTGDFQQ